MIVRHSGRNQNVCGHSAAGTATAERSIWGQVLGRDLSRRVLMTCRATRRAFPSTAEDYESGTRAVLAASRANPDSMPPKSHVSIPVGSPRCRG
jgi:hypothetical protein